MFTELLPTKLFVPPLRPDLVPRERLLARLDEGLRSGPGFMRRLTLVAAPAGFGKTTLVVAWLNRLDLTVAWLSLNDEDDRDSFFRYLSAAVRQIPGVGQKLTALLESPQPVPAATLSHALLQDVVSAAEPFIVVLDDYHVLNDAEIDAALADTLEHLPPHVHLVITSRALPALPLPRLRARAQLLELTAADLRFTPEEAAQFLHDTMGLALDADAVVALEERTEGWVAGLQMAAIAIQASPEAEQAAAFIDAFAGDDQYIFDYLVEEVLAGQDEATQKFLLQTSILERMSAALCDAVTGQANGTTMLRKLHDTNLFVIPLDNRRRWYRYHHLFADLLRRRLQWRQPQQPPQLHRRAAGWYAQNGFTDEAIRHALEAGDPARAAEFIEAVGRSLIMRGQLALLRRWLARVPATTIRARVHLSSIDVATEFAAAMPTRDFDTLESHVAGALQLLDEMVLPAAEHDQLRGELHGHEALLALNRGDVDRADVLIHKALEYAADHDDYLLGYFKLGLGAIHRLRGQIGPAVKTLQEASAHSRRADSPLLDLTAMTSLAELYEVLGELSKAAAVYHEALTVAVGESGQALPIAGMPHVGLAKVHRERNELEPAERHLQEAIDLGELGEVTAILLDAFITQALVLRARQQWEAAYAALDRADHLIIAAHEGVNQLRTGAFRSRLQLAQGQMAEPVAWARHYGLTVDAELDVRREIEHLTLVRILLTAGEASAAQTFLARLEAAARHADRRGSLVEVLILQALAAAAQNDLPLAFEQLEATLQLAQPEGYVRLFADEGLPLARLIQRYAAENRPANQGRLAAYAQSLLAVIRQEAGVQTTAPTSPLPEPLSDRELQILKLIAAGLSNQEIADQLFLTVGTVKSYNYNLFAKLGVRRRTEAVERGRELGLI